MPEENLRLKKEKVMNIEQLKAFDASVEIIQLINSESRLGLEQRKNHEEMFVRWANGLGFDLLGSIEKKKQEKTLDNICVTFREVIKKRIEQENYAEA